MTLGPGVRGRPADAQAATQNSWPCGCVLKGHRGNGRVTAGISRNQREFLERKVTVSEMADSLEGASRRLGLVEEEIGELEDVTVETSHLKQREGNRWKM